MDHALDRPPHGVRDVHVVVPTRALEDDLDALVGRHGFRIDAIFPADAPSTAIVSGHGIRVRLERSDDVRPVTFHLLGDEPASEAADAIELPGGSRFELRPFTTGYILPPNRPSLVVTHDDGSSGVGRAGMRYRDLLPDRWGGRFIASHITIPDGGPVPDYVHFHKIRFQLIFVKDGWVRLVYEDQGDPFVMHTGDAVLQPPQIRHRVLEASPGLEVIEIGCPAEHETIADWALPLPNGVGDPTRTWEGQRFVRHVAADASYAAWRLAGWEHRDTGIGDATDGLAGVRVARPVAAAAAAEADVAPPVPVDAEYCQLVVLHGAVTFEADGHDPVRLADGAAVAIPGGLPHRLVDPTSDCELLDVTLPA